MATPHILQQIADNEPLFEAVKEVILSHFEPTQFPDMDKTSDKQLGEFLRARLAGKRLVDAGFTEISRHKTKGDAPVGVNRAR